MAPSVSIIMPAYKRAEQLTDTFVSISQQTRQPNQIVIVEDGPGDGNTKLVCDIWSQGAKKLPIEYYCRKNRPNVGYSNAAIPKNIGIRKATGDILILQCPEVKYSQPTDIENLIAPLSMNDAVSIYAPTLYMDQTKQPGRWMAGPKHLTPMNGGDLEFPEEEFIDMCQAVWRHRVVAIGGFDESYTVYGIEDNDFSDRLYESGVDRFWSQNVVALHQWHGFDARMQKEFDSVEGKQALDLARTRYKQRRINWADPVANAGKNWGNINS